MFLLIQKIKDYQANDRNGNRNTCFIFQTKNQNRKNQIDRHLINLHLKSHKLQMLFSRV